MIRKERFGAIGIHIPKTGSQRREEFPDHIAGNEFCDIWLVGMTIVDDFLLSIQDVPGIHGLDQWKFRREPH